MGWWTGGRDATAAAHLPETVTPDIRRILACGLCPSSIGRRDGTAPSWTHRSRMARDVGDASPPHCRPSRSWAVSRVYAGALMKVTCLSAGKYSGRDNSNENNNKNSKHMIILMENFWCKLSYNTNNTNYCCLVCVCDANDDRKGKIFAILWRKRNEWQGSCKNMPMLRVQIPK